MRIASCCALLVCSVALAVHCGCGQPEATVDSEPFETAIGQYLQANNMAMELKEIKQGPTVSDGTATLTASLVPQGLGSPRVTWVFHFTRGSGDTWAVARHED
jgi:hypothetical protein